MLDTINSRHQRVVVGCVCNRLPDAIVKWISSRLPLGTADVGAADTTGDRNSERTQARVLPLNELKDKLEAMEGVSLNSSTPLPITTR